MLYYCNLLVETSKNGHCLSNDQVIIEISVNWIALKYVLSTHQYQMQALDNLIDSLFTGVWSAPYWQKLHSQEATVSLKDVGSC